MVQEGEECGECGRWGEWGSREGVGGGGEIKKYISSPLPLQDDTKN
ncbi:MAG: hypothetical protein WBA93_20645 [Microcoleaceae cyanobacterium]